MEPCHYLYVMKSDGNRPDMLAKAKQWSPSYWFFAFSPKEYQTNLEEVVKLNNLTMRYVGYETTIEEALKRLKDYQDQLKPLYGKPMSSKYEIPFERTYLNIIRFRYFLESYQSHDKLVLNQSDGSEQALLYDTSGAIIGLHPVWYQNEALENDKIIKKYLKASLSLEEKVEELTKEFPNQDLFHFYDELNEISWNSRKEDWSDFSASYIQENNECIHTDNPTMIFQALSKSVLATSHISEQVKLNTLNEIKNIMNETLEYMGEKLS